MESQAEADNTTVHARMGDAVKMTREERFSDALEMFEEHLPSLTEGNLSDKRVAAASFSYYGLCVAMVKRKYADAVKYCNISLRANFMDPAHRANLALVYLERNDRRKAVETLNAGLKLDPSDRRINRIFDQIGRRRQPVVPFLHRNNPLNIWLGRLRGKPRNASA